METVLVAADAIKRLKMYPYFDVAHYILNCMSVRDDTYPQQTTGTWPGRSAVTFSVLACFTCVLPAVTGQLADRPTRRQPTRRQTNSPTNQLADGDAKLCGRCGQCGRRIYAGRGGGVPFDLVRRAA